MKASPAPRPHRRPYAWLTVLILVMTVVAVGAGVLALHYVEARLVAMAGESLSLAAAEVADKLDRFLFERYGDVRMMAQAFSGRRPDPSELTRYLQRMKQSYGVYLWLGVANERGRVIAATDPGTLGMDVRRRTWFQAARAGPVVLVGDVEPYELVGGMDSVAFTATLLGPKEEFAGVVMTRVGLPAIEGMVTRTIRSFRERESFLGTIEYQFLTRDGLAFVDSDLAHKGGVNLKRLGLPSARLLEAGAPGYTLEAHLRRHVPVLTGYARTQGLGEFEGLGWGVLVRMDEADVLAPIRAVLLKLTLVGALIWGPMFVLLLWAVGRVRREYAQAQQESARAREAEATLREGARRLRARHAATQVLAEARTMKEAGGRILQAICESLDWELGVIWIVDRPAQVLRCVDLWRARTRDVGEFEAATRQRTFSLGIGLPGRVWASGEPAWIPDVVTDRNFPRAPAAARAGLHAAFGFPIRLQGQVLGVIEFFSHEIRQPDEDLLLLFADIGGKIGQFIGHKQLEEQFRQAQKMEAVGQLARGIAHDFNNLLTVIAGYCQLMLRRPEMPASLRADIEEIRKASDRAAGLTQQLLAFSRRQLLQPKPMNLNRTVAAMEPMLRRLIGEHIELVTELAPDLGQIRADPGQMEQVVMNLVVNARDAMPQGGRLTIRTANADLSGASAQRPDLPPGSYVVLLVSDTGTGMDAVVRSHIFEPFYTTKGIGKGTGLGLSTVYGIVKQSDGDIVVESEPGAGTTFTIYLPRMDEGGAVEPTRDDGGDRAEQGSETILLAEDEDMIRTMVSRVLRARGYRVLEARDGSEAVRLGTEAREPIHLLLTDVVMPGMNGKEVAATLAAAHPEMRVLYISGYTDNADVSCGVLGERADFLQKPFTPETLTRRVRETLSRPRDP
ncbi:ATP-binding protein [Nitrospira sp. Kam-Ns4a]